MVGIPGIKILSCSLPPHRDRRFFLEPIAIVMAPSSSWLSAQENHYAFNTKTIFLEFTWFVALAIRIFLGDKGSEVPGGGDGSQSFRQQFLSIGLWRFLFARFSGFAAAPAPPFPVSIAPVALPVPISVSVTVAISASSPFPSVPVPVPVFAVAVSASVPVAWSHLGGTRRSANDKLTSLFSVSKLEN